MVNTVKMSTYTVGIVVLRNKSEMFIHSCQNLQVHLCRHYGIPLTYHPLLDHITNISAASHLKTLDLSKFSVFSIPLPQTIVRRHETAYGESADSTQGEPLYGPSSITFVYLGNPRGTREMRELSIVVLKTPTS